MVVRVHCFLMGAETLDNNMSPSTISILDLRKACDLNSGFGLGLILDNIMV